MKNIFCHYCDDEGCEKCRVKPMTNSERIRQMSDEELADFILTCNDKFGNCNDCLFMSYEACDEDGCKKGILEYLKAEVE